MARFLQTIGYGMGCGAMLVGSLGALLSFWYVLFDNLGSYFDFDDVVFRLTDSVTFGMMGALVGGMIGLFFGFLVYTASEHRHVTRLLSVGGFALTLILGTASVDVVDYREASVVVVNVVGLLYILGFCIIGYYGSVFWGDWFERRINRL